MNQRWFVWILLILSVAAIPAAYFGKQSKTVERSSESSSALFDTMRFRDRIQVVKLSGMIVDRTETSLLSPNDSAPACLKALRKALKDKKVKAILLRINSPGGTVPTSQELSIAVNKLREKDIPVYVSMSDLAASGGYYVACSADRIFALPGTLTGSIGVILSTFNLKELGDKVGIKPEVVKSGKFKDIASPYRQMTPEERQLLQQLIMDSYEQFVAAVAKGRKMKVEEVKKVADGRIISGQQAKKLGLIDDLGGYEEALDELQKTCMEKYKLNKKLPVDDKSTEGFLSSLLESSSEGSNLAPFLSSRGMEIQAELIPEFLSRKFHNQPLWIMP